MPIQNVFEIDVDIKQKTAIRTPTVTQNDAVVFVFRVFDEGRIYNIQGGSTFTMTSIRPDKQSVVSAGAVKNSNIVEFKLGTTEISVEGKVQSVIQVYDVAGRVSTIPFSFTVLKDPTENYISSTEDKTLIQQVLGEGPAILAGAEQATVDANTAAADANDKAILADTATNNANAAASNADNAAVKANDKAFLAEQKAILADTAAQGADIATTEAEQATRNAQSATQAINLVLPNVEGLEYVEPYNAATTYSKNNIVSHEGSSFISLQNSNIGNTPTKSVNTHWGLLALKGLDGLGSVVSVNDISPDANGNVTLDLSGLATKQELNDLDDEVVRHLEDKDNPHNVTAEQVGAVKKTGDTMLGPLNMGNNIMHNVKDLRLTNTTKLGETVGQRTSLSVEGNRFDVITSDGSEYILRAEFNTGILEFKRQQLWHSGNLTYEEGTWTPTFIGDSGSISSYSVQQGRYRKIGKQVTVSAVLQTPDSPPISNQLTGALKIGGIPFAANYVGGGIAISFLRGISYKGQITGETSNTNINLFETKEDGNYATINASAATGGNIGSTRFKFTLTYLTD